MRQFSSPRGSLEGRSKLGFEVIDFSDKLNQDISLDRKESLEDDSPQTYELQSFQNFATSEGLLDSENISFFK